MASQEAQMNQEATFRSGGARTIAAACLFVTGLGMTCRAWADDEPIRRGEETLKINLGGIIASNNTKLRIDGPNNQGTEFNLEDVAGLKRDQSSVYAAAAWRFASNHRIGVEVFDTRRSATKTIDRDLQIGDENFAAGSTMSTETNAQFFIVNYQYSFIKNSDLELAGIFGLYGGRFSFKFDGIAANVNESITVPLPMFGASLDYFVNPRWTVSVLGEGLKLKIGNVEGLMYNVGVSTDYMLTRHLGLGIGYNVAGIRVDASGDTGFEGHIGWQMRSLSAYAQARF